jgi:hypothetical protein
MTKSARTGCSTQHFLLAMAYLAHHLTPSLTTNQACSLLVQTRSLSGLSVPVAAGLVHHIIPLLLLVSLSFSTSYWLPVTTPSYTPCLYLCPFASTIHFTLRCRQQGPPKHWYPYNTTQHHNPEDLNVNLQWPSVVYFYHFKQLFCF